METESTIFWNTLGSAIGGFIGLFLFFAIRYYIEFKRKRPKIVNEYYIANEINIGQDYENKGLIMHKYGKLVNNKEEYNKVGYKYPVWEWCEDKHSRYDIPIFYGPYTTDLNEPGDYEIDFYIKGIGFSKPEEIINDSIILELVINEIQNRVEQKIDNYGMNSKFSALTGNNLITISQPNVIGIRYLKISDLAKNNSNRFTIRVSTLGKGVWEFRAFAYDGVGRRPDNLLKYKDTVRIIFDKIIIRKIYEIKLPWD